MKSFNSNIIWGSLSVFCATFLISTQVAATEQSSNVMDAKQTSVQDQSTSDVTDTMEVVGNNGVKEEFRPKKVAMGPLGDKDLKDLPYSAYVLNEEFLKDRNIKGLSDAIKYDSSADIEARGGLDLGRPQTRGVEGSVMQNTHVDGMNVVATTFQPMEFYQRLEIIHSLTGALYGPAAPSGNFNYEFKRPTADYRNVVNLDVDSNGAREGSIDVGGTPGEYFGYRVTALKEQGDGYVSGSIVKRKGVGVAFDIYPTYTTTVELNYSYYQNQKYGFPGAFAYTAETGLPSAVDATKQGYGQSYAGTDLKTSMASLKIKQKINDDWKAEAGVLTQTVDRLQLGVTNTLNGDGTFTQTMSTQAIAGRFKVLSNEGRINGDIYTGNIEHQLTFGTTGYEWKIYGATGNSGSRSVTLGTDIDLDNPEEFDSPTFYTDGSLVTRSRTKSQSGIFADVINWNEQWSSIIAASYDHFDSYSSSANYHKGGYSSTESILFKPVETTTTYIAYSDTLEAGSVVTDTSYDNYGDILEPIRSRQIETGIKQDFGAFDGNLALFRIKRPIAYVVDNVYGVQGMQRNYGAELGLNGAVTEQLKMSVNATLLDAKLVQAANDSANGKRVIGVPKVAANWLTEYDIAMVPGLSVNANVHYVGNRAANTTNTVWLGSYTTLDLGAKYTTKHFYGKELTVRLNVDNITDERYWASAFSGNYSGATSSSEGGSAFLGNPLQARLTTSIAF